MLLGNKRINVKEASYDIQKCTHTPPHTQATFLGIKMYNEGNGYDDKQ